MQHPPSRGSRAHSDGGPLLRRLTYVPLLRAVSTGPSAFFLFCFLTYFRALLGLEILEYSSFPG